MKYNIRAVHDTGIKTVVEFTVYSREEVSRILSEHQKARTRNRARPDCFLYQNEEGPTIIQLDLSAFCVIIANKVDEPEEQE